MADNDVSKLAKDIIALGEDRLAEVLAEINQDARDALRSFVHPETGALLQVKGVEAAHPPRHESGGL